jgi:Domain of unknown function (DUF4347)
MAKRTETAWTKTIISDVDAHTATPSSSAETIFMTANPKREIAFIDRRVDHLQTLLAGIRPDIEAILLSNDEPAPRQMARAVQGRGDLDAIHVIAHGRAGEVSFGAAALSLQTLDESATDLALVGQALGNGGDLRLWSCYTGCGERGSQFIGALASATGARVAAERISSARLRVVALGS